jgi:hypothetical protein
MKQTNTSIIVDRARAGVVFFRDTQNTVASAHWPLKLPILWYSLLAPSIRFLFILLLMEHRDRDPGVLKRRGEIWVISLSYVEL